MSDYGVVRCKFIKKLCFCNYFRQFPSTFSDFHRIRQIHPDMVAIWFAGREFPDNLLGSDKKILYLRLYQVAMDNKKRITAGIVLALVYAFFFASTNLFYHSHTISNVRIVHSHPWSGAAHTHSDTQISLIEIFDSSVYAQAELVVIESSVPETIPATESIAPVGKPYCRGTFILSFRAPPAYC